MSSLTDLRYNGNRLYKKKCLISIKEGQKKDSPIKNTDESSLVAGTGLSFISFRMDINGGLQRKAQTTS